MSVTNSASKITFTLTGYIGEYFDFSFKFYRKEDIIVKISADDGVTESALILDYDYQITPVQDNYPDGARVVLLKAQTPGIIAVSRYMVFEQLMSLPMSGPLNTAALENQLDKIVMLCQQLNEQIGRGISFSMTYNGALTSEAMLENIQAASTSAADAVAVLAQIQVVLDAAETARDEAILAAQNASMASSVPLEASAAQVAAGIADTELVRYYVSPEALISAINNLIQIPLVSQYLLLGIPSETGNRGLKINNSDTNKPELRYNDFANSWEFSNDGVVFLPIGSSSASAGASSYTAAGHTDNYYTVSIASLTLSSGLFIRIVPDISGLVKIKINGGSAINIFGGSPIQAGYCYDLYYDSANSCFIAWRKAQVIGPASANDYSKKWDSYGNIISATAEVNRTASAYSLFGNISSQNNPYNTLVGGGPNMVLLPNGNVYCVPYFGTEAKILLVAGDDSPPYSVATSGAITAFPALTTLAKYSCGLLLRSGKVLLIPCVWDYAWAIPKVTGLTQLKLKLYDYTDDSYVNLNSAIATGAVGNVFNGGAVELPSGKVLITPQFAGTTCYLLDPVADTVTTVPGLMDVSTSKSSPILAPNGRVYVFTSTVNYYEYNPDTNCVSKLTGNTIIAGRSGTTMLANGMIWPGNGGDATPDALFNAWDKSFAYLGDKINISVMTSSCLLPDGRIFIAGLPVNARIYDPYTDAVIIPSNTATPPVPLPLGTAVDTAPSSIWTIGRHCLLLPNGKILVSTYNGTNWFIFSNTITQTNFPNGVLMSGILNKR